MKIKKVVGLILACSVLFAGCLEREPDLVPFYLEDDNNSSFTVLEVPLFDANNLLQIIEEFDTNNELDVIFVPTPQDVVDKMLELAKVQKDDLVYDLGC